MRDSEKKKSGIDIDAKELRELVLKYPDLPLLVFAGDSANEGDYSWMLCSYVKAEKGEFLDCKQGVNDEIVFTDRSDFEDELTNMLYDFTEEEINAELKKYEPYWKPCILVWVNK